MWAFQKLIVAIAGYIPRYSSLFKNIYCCTWHISLYFWMGFLCCQKAVLGNNKLFLFYLFLGRSFACEDSLFSFFLFIKCFCFSFFGKNICPDKRIYETLKSAREDVQNCLNCCTLLLNEWTFEKKSTHLLFITKLNVT